MKILRLLSPLIALGMIMSPTWAADEATIEDLQTNVNVTKGKADKNAQDITSLKGGLPALEARVAALEEALSVSNDTVDQLQESLAEAIAQIGQLQSDLNAEVSARQAGDSEVGAAYMAADAVLQAQVDVLSAVDIGALDNRIANVEETLTCVAYDAVTRDMIFVGCNVHVRDGTGSTQSISGLGNLIVGYNADAYGMLDRSGSHNLVLGDDQAYAAVGELLTRSVGSSQDLSVVVGGNLSETISIGRTTNIGSDFVLTVGSDMETIVGKNMTESITKDSASSIGGNLTSLIDKDATVTVGGNLAEVVAQNFDVQAGVNMSLQGADQLALTSGDATILMKKNGDIALQGKKINIKGSGNVTIKGSLVLEN